MLFFGVITMRSSTQRRIAFSLVGVLVSASLLAETPQTLEPEETVRLASVNAPFQSGLLEYLLQKFETESGYRVEISAGTDAFYRARAGSADIVLSHYGKSEVEEFVSSGLGSWPRMVFSNQMALIGPEDDPAGISNTTDPVAAMRRIAEARAPFLTPANAGSRYLASVLLAAAGEPDRTGWYEESTEKRGQAMRLAEERGAYTLWGAFPFARYQARHGGGLKVMLAASPLMQRVMATVRVNPDRFEGVNAAGAAALEAYLLRPDTQAAVLLFREPGQQGPSWWPAARNNDHRLMGSDSVGAEDDF